MLYKEFSLVSSDGTVLSVHSWLPDAHGAVVQIAHGAVVQAYAADEYCGNTATAAFIDQLLYGTRAAYKKETFCGTPKDLPLFIGAGEQDTMGGPSLKEVKKDVADYKKRV